MFVKENVQYHEHFKTCMHKGSLFSYDQFAVTRSSLIPAESSAHSFSYPWLQITTKVEVNHCMNHVLKMSIM